MPPGGSAPARSAGAFSAWLSGMRAALRGERDADVPCAGCTACCRSSQFVHIGPDETETLARIPAALRFPAPHLPPGHAVLGYDEQGRCPMLGEQGCTIYEHRPRACRTYDCRIFAAAGVDLPDKPLVAERARSWQFELPAAVDRREQAAVREAAVFLRAHPEAAPEGVDLSQPTALAVLAVELSAARPLS